MAVRIQTPQHQQKLRTEFKLRQEVDLELEDLIQPVAVIADLSGQSVASTSYPRDCVGTTSRAAGGAGTHVECIVQGVGGRGIVYELTRIIVRRSVDGICAIRVGNGGVAAISVAGASSYADLRAGGLPDCQIGSAIPLAAALDGDEVGQLALLGDRSVVIPLSFVMAGGDFVLISNSTANEHLATTFFWTEHLLEDR